MQILTGAPARTLAVAAVGATLVATLGACSSGGDASSAPSAATSAPTAAVSSAAPSTPSPSPSRATRSAAPLPKYVDTIPADLRRSMFTQGAVPASYADWISTSPSQSTQSGRVDVQIDRRLPPCSKDAATHYDHDRTAAGFAARVFQAGDYVVARQLTVYHDANEAKAAVQEMVDKNGTCQTFAGKAVTATNKNDLVDAGELDVPQHEGTVAGETSIAVGGGTGASWWTVISREKAAVVLTRVVDPKAKVHPDGSTSDSIAFRQAVLDQARASAHALDPFAG